MDSRFCGNDRGRTFSALSFSSVNRTITAISSGNKAHDKILENTLLTFAFDKSESRQTILQHS